MNVSAIEGERCTIVVLMPNSCSIVYSEIRLASLLFETEWSDEKPNTQRNRKNEVVETIQNKKKSLA